MLTAHAAKGVRLAREHLDALGEATPYRLDDATVAGVIRTWEVTRNDLGQLFAEQGRRWLQEARVTRQQGNVEHFCAVVAEERGLVALAHRLASVSRLCWVGRPAGVYPNLTSGTQPAGRQVGPQS